MIRPSGYLINPLLLALLLMLLSTVGVMLFRFYGIKSYEEIGTSQRALESAVFRSCMREVQRLSLMVPVLKQLDTETEEELRDSIEEAMLIFSAEGEIPHMISAIGYRRATAPESLFRFDREWARADEPIHGFFRDDEAEMKQDDFMVLERNPELPDQLIILYHPGSGKNYIIQAEMNVTEFHRHYIEPAAQEILEGYELKWTVSDAPEQWDDESKRDPQDRFSLENYRFSPLAALSGRIYNEEKDIRIRIPSPLYLSGPLILKEAIPGDGEDGDSRDREDDFFFKRSRPFMNGKEHILLAGYPDGPFYLNIERKHALDWLQSMLLLLGIGAIFLILMIQQSRLRQLREREKEFVASMTHELRTPLTVIRSASDNLSRGIISPERLPRYGRLIQDQVLRLSNMIEEILMFSSMEGKGPPPEAVEMEIQTLLDELKSAVGTVASERAVTLYWDREGLPLRGLGDPELIRLVVNNLIMNGINHAYSGAEEGTIRVKAHLSIPDSLRVTVEDEGRGIPSGEQNKIFQPFYRDSISRRNQEKGSGLGLYIAKKKIEAAGGELKLESPYTRVDGKKQQGCRFSFSLPFLPIED